MDARYDLSPEKRAQIVALNEGAFSQRRIAGDLHCSQAVVGNIILRFRETGS